MIALPREAVTVVIKIMMYITRLLRVNQINQTSLKFRTILII